MKINIGDIVPDSYWDNHINNPANEKDICPYSYMDGEEDFEQEDEEQEDYESE